MFQRGQIAIGAAASIMMLLALAVVLVPYALWRSGARAARPPVVDATFDLALDLQARGESLRFALRRVAIYSFLGLFALIYLLPLFVVIANSFRELPEITENGLDRISA